MHDDPLVLHLEDGIKDPKLDRRLSNAFYDQPTIGDVLNATHEHAAALPYLDLKRRQIAARTRRRGRRSNRECGREHKAAESPERSHMHGQY